jgi:transposase
MKTVQARTSEIQRLGKALESAGIKLGSVTSSMTGVSATAMIESLIDGERCGAVLANLAVGRMRTAGKLADLSMALTGRFTGHHALLCRLHQDRIADFDAAVAGLDERIAGKVARWRREAGLLTSVSGFGDAVTQAWLAEIGPAPHLHLASHEKLACWVSLCPGNNISARKRKYGRTGDAGTYIKPMLVQAAWAAIRVRGRLQARYRRLVRRFGGDKNPRGEEGGDHRSRAHPAEDRLPGPQVRRPLHRAGRRLLHPAGITGAEAGLAGAPAPETPPRLRRHHHHQPPAGRITRPALNQYSHSWPGSRR